MFFLPKEEVPEGVGFTTFGLTHLIWLVSMALIAAVVIVVYRKADPNKKNIIRLILGWLIVFSEILKNIVAAATGSFGVGHLPFHLCGINILIILFDLFKPTKVARNFLYYFCIPGAMLALLFPNWTVLPSFNFFCIHSFTIHAMLVLYPILLSNCDDFKPEIKQMVWSIALLVAMAIPIYFINLWLDTNFMFLMDPEQGNPLGLFETYLGSHLWGFPILLPIVMFVMYIPFFFIKKKPKTESPSLKTNEEKEEVKI